MKKHYFLIAFLVLILSTTIAVVAFGAESHGGHGGGHGGGYRGHGVYGWHGGFRGGIWIGPTWGPWWGEPWWGYSYPYYNPYYYEPPIQQQPSIYMQQEPTQEKESYYWYFCTKPEGYYPYVKRCPGGWLKVVPAPPSDHPDNQPDNY